MSLRKFEEAEQETQERLQNAVLDGKEVDQLKKDQETVGVSVAFLRQFRDSVIVKPLWDGKPEINCDANNG